MPTTNPGPFPPADEAERRPRPEAQSQTVALPPPLPPPESGPGTTPAAGDPTEARVALVEGTGPHLSGEIRALRQDRLRAATTFLIASVGVFLLWRVNISSAPEIWVLNAAVLAGLGALLAAMSGRRPIPDGRLKALEYAVFGLMAGFIAVRHFHEIVEAGRKGGPTLLAAARGTLIGSNLLMFVYAMLIPNTWRAAARVVLPIAALPVIVSMAATLVDPQVARAFRGADNSVDLLTENLLFGLIASGLSIFGVHVINGLRAEAFAARQLNQYRLVAPIGSGGMGEVYLAEHRLLKRDCALKLIRPDRAIDPKSLARFEREVRATARLSHPNTVEIYDYGHTDDGTFYYVMEYLPGRNLQELIDRHGPLPPARAVYLLRQACGALTEAHGAGLIHRDLKPANLFVARRGGKPDVVKLLDFGLVREVALASIEAAGPGDSRESTVQGTPLYMSPEQARGQTDIDARADLYALGGVAYAMLTGRPPFEGETRVATMLANAHDPVVPPSKARPGLPEDLEQIVLRLLSKDRNDRHPDAESLERDLALCDCAGDWDSHWAELWWRDFEPEGVGRDDDPPRVSSSG